MSSHHQTLVEIASGLGVDPSTCDSDKVLYYEIARRSHPDKVRGKEDLFKRASLAYEQLTKSTVPSSYDDLFAYFGAMHEMFRFGMEENRRDMDELSRRIDKIRQDMEEMKRIAVILEGSQRSRMRARKGRRKAPSIKKQEGFYEYFTTLFSEE
jgi:DnaJ-class molecular chaperone